MTVAAPAQKILLVTPPYHYGLADVLGRWIPLNLVYLAGAARQTGLDVEIYDALNAGDGYPEIERRLADSDAAYVACTAVTATVNDALKTLELAKRLHPESVTLLGGVHASGMYRELLESAPFLDFVVIGEGEETLRELLAVLQKGADPVTVPGIALRRDGQVLRSAERPLIPNLDELSAAWDLLDWPRYTYHVIPGSRLGSIGTSRGCDRHCTFCSQNEFWCHCWRGRDPRQVIFELERLVADHGVTLVQLTDEHPTRDRERWELFLDLLIEKGLPVQLILETRPGDLVRDRDIIGKYREAGVIHVSLGVESPEQARLDQLEKEMQLEEAAQALELLRDNSIVSEVSFVLGFPDETMEHVTRTLKYAQALNPDSANFLALTPWPWSGLYRELREHIRADDFSRYNLIDPVLEPRQMSLSQMELALVDCFRKFYMGKMFEVMTMKDEFRRGYMVRATKIIMASPFVFKKFGLLVRGMLPGKK